jgi:hypothetical protein
MSRKAADRLGFRDLFATDGQVLLDDRAHRLLDARQVLRHEARPGRLKS